MNLTLTRVSFSKDGVFGSLTSDDGELHLCTVERAYPNGSDFTTKVVDGVYRCIRHSPNRLPYETFMLQDVPAFQKKPVTGILIHIANKGSELDGCIGVGETIGTIDGIAAVLQSRISFERLMHFLDEEDDFYLFIISRN